MKKICVAVIVLISIVPLSAGNNALTNAFTFLSIDFNPRSAATANAFSTMREDIGSMLINPAGMAGVSQQKYTFNYTAYLLDINGGIVGYAYPLKGYGVLSAAITYLDYGTMQKTNNLAAATGATFGAADFALTVGWSAELQENISYGVNLKYIHSQLESYGASAVALDFGALYKAPFEDNLYFAFAVLNLGSNFEYYAKTKASLPTTMRFGVSKKLAHLPLEISLSLLDLNKSADTIGEYFKRFAIGGEFTLSESLRLRLGYDNALHSDLKTIDASQFGGLAGGVGIYYGKYRFDYTYSNYNLLGNTHRFGISAVLD